MKPFDPQETAGQYIDRLEARIEALETALQSIVQWSDTYPVGHVTDYAGKIARTALDKDAGK